MSIIKGFFKEFIKRLPGTLIVSLIWFILGWLIAFGKQAVFLIPINYLSGAVLGLSEQSFIGGMFGRTILMLLFNSFLTTLIVTRGSISERVKAAGKGYITAIGDTIPYFKNLREFPWGEGRARGLGVAGIGFAMLTYGFFTGDGSAINSFVCVVIFVKIAQETVNRRGIITALLNLVLSRFGRRRVSKKPVDHFMNGYGLGMLLSIVYAFVCGIQWVAYATGAVLFLMGIVSYVFSSKAVQEKIKQVAVLAVLFVVTVTSVIPFVADDEPQIIYENQHYWKSAVFSQGLPAWAEYENLYYDVELYKNGELVPITTDVGGEEYVKSVLKGESIELPKYELCMSTFTESVFKPLEGSKVYSVEVINQEVKIRFQPQVQKDIVAELYIEGTYKLYYNDGEEVDLRESEEFELTYLSEVTYRNRSQTDYREMWVDVDDSFYLAREITMLDQSTVLANLVVEPPTLCFDSFVDGKVHDVTGAPIEFVGDASLVQPEGDNPEYVIGNVRLDGEPIDVTEVQLGAFDYVDILEGTKDGELPVYAFEILDYDKPLLGFDDENTTILNVVNQKMELIYSPELGIYFPFLVNISGTYDVQYRIEDGDNVTYENGTCTLNYGGKVWYENITFPSEGAQMKVLVACEQSNSSEILNYITFDREVDLSKTTPIISYPSLYVDRFSYNGEYTPVDVIEPEEGSTSNEESESVDVVPEPEVPNEEEQENTEETTTAEEELAEVTMLVISSATVAISGAAIAGASSLTTSATGAIAGAGSADGQINTSVADVIDNWLTQKGCSCELIINEGTDYPDIICEKDRIVEIPVRIEGNTTAPWIFVAACLCERDNKRVIKSICVPTGEKSALVTITLKGDEVDKEEKVYCTVMAYNGESDKYALVEIMDFTLMPEKE